MIKFPLWIFLRQVCIVRISVSVIFFLATTITLDEGPVYSIPPLDIHYKWSLDMCEFFGTQTRSHCTTYMCPCQRWIVFKLFRLKSQMCTKVYMYLGTYTYLVLHKMSISLSFGFLNVIENRLDNCGGTQCHVHYWP